jgi:hypothetical protein
MAAFGMSDLQMRDGRGTTTRAVRHSWPSQSWTNGQIPSPHGTGLAETAGHLTFMRLMP